MAAEEYLGGTSGVTKIEFKERKKYLDYVNSSEVKFLDTIYERKLYGLVNDDYEIIAPIPNTKLFGDYSPDIYGLNYTVDIFNEFRKFYTDLIINSDISTPYLIDGLKPSKSFVSFDENYKKYIGSVGTTLSTAIITDGNNPQMNFSRFVTIAQEKLLEQNFMKYKITKSGYALAPESNVHQTGLYVDLGKNYTANLDSVKVELVTDPQFPCYAQYVQQYGFQIDFNSPWRLALDLEDEFVQDNILNGRPREFFKDFYSTTLTVKVGGDDFWATKTFYELLYIQYCTEIGLQSIPDDFSNLRMDQWLEIFLRERFRELGLLNYRMTESNLFEKNLVKMLDIYNMYGIQLNYGAISFVNKFCSDTLKLIVEGKL